MLRVEIAGRWSAKDFAKFYDAVDALYSLFALIEIEQQSAYEYERRSHEFLNYNPLVLHSPKRFRYFLEMQRAITGMGHAPIEPAKFRDAASLLEEHERLAVRRCEYASPGVTDFTGLGQAPLSS